MHAAKHFDPQLGIDIHLYVFPPLPVPIPLPTPHLGIVLDPFDYIPIIGGTVHVNGVKRATAGTGGLDVHIPLGPWMPTMKMPGGPQWDDEIFMGSMTVVADGDPLSRIAMPVLDCNIVGLINPFRLRKPKKPQLSLSLPTSVNLAIPNHVNVGGPPMISIMGLAFKGVFAGLGRLRKLKAVQRAFDGAGNRWRKLFSNMDPGFLKCKVLRAEPVDVRSGAVSVTQEDFSIPGRLPLTWTRRYRSDEIHRQGVCGWGWTTPADIRLELDEDGVLFLPMQGPPAVYERLPLPGEGLIDPIDGARLTRVALAQGDELHLRTKDGLVHVFAAPPAHHAALPGQPPRALRIERLEDRCGNAWTFQREGEHLKRIVERGLDSTPGRFIEVASQGGRIHAMQLHDPLSGSTWPLLRYRQDEHGDLVAVLDALDAARRFDYRAHRLVRHTDRVGLSFHYDYDEQARVVHSWGDGGLYDYHFAYHEALHETEVTDSLGHTSLIKFDADGLPLCEIDPLGGCTFFEYDEWGRTTAVTDPCGLRTEMVYDLRGNLIEWLRPDSSRVRAHYSEDDLIVALIDAGDHTWAQRWDGRGLLVEQITPSAASTRYEYTDRGQMLATVDPLGARTSYGYDVHGQPSQVTDPLGSSIIYCHDARGTLIERRVGGQVVRFAHDAKGRTCRADLPGGGIVRCLYDAEDQLVEIVDASGAVTRTTYAGLGCVASRIHPDGRESRYRYDTEERLVEVNNERGERFQLRRDELGRVIEEIDYWGQPRRFAFDPGGRLTAIEDASGRTVRVSCDAMGRAVRRLVPADDRNDGMIVESFKYDARGFLIEARSGNRHVHRVFNIDGRLVQETQNGFRIEHRFDAAGNRIQRRTSAGHVVNFAFDACGRLSSLAVNDREVLRIENDDLGRPAVERIGAVVTRRFGYHADGMPALQSIDAGEHRVWSVGFTFDRAGNLLSRADSHSGTTSCRYDANGRLIGETLGRTAESRHLLDAAGDRLHTRVLESTAHALVNGQAAPASWIREGRLADTSYRFDRNGNLRERTTVRQGSFDRVELTWDADMRLARSCRSEQGGTARETSYAYDALGRRVSKSGPEGVTRYFWDGDLMIAELTEARDGTPEPITAGKVIDFAAARRRAHEDQERFRCAREYVYRPGTFEPLVLIEGELANHPGCRNCLAETPGTPLAAAGLQGNAASARGPREDKSGPRLGETRLGLAPQAAMSPSTSSAGLVLGAGAMLGAGALDKPETPRQTVLTSVRPNRGTVYHFCNDINGSPLRLISDQGDSVWDIAHRTDSPGGAAPSNSTWQPLRLQGQYFDAETGLHYNRHRYFDPAANQFIAQDPLRLAADDNLYGYGRNVYASIDPLGLYEEFGIFPYKSHLHAGDGLTAHELLQNAWLRQNGYASGRAAGIARGNPAIALEESPLHKAIGRMQAAAGLNNPAVLRGQGSLRNINMNAVIMKRALFDDLLQRGWDPGNARAFAHARTRELRRQAIAFARANVLRGCG